MKQSISQWSQSWAALAVLLLVAAITCTAEAADDKTYPAAMCYFHVGSQTIQTSGGVLMNYYYDHVSAECPIVRDNIFNTNGPKDVWVRAKDSLGDGNNITCTLLATSWNGWGFEYETKEVDGYWSGSLHLNLDTSFSGGYYYLQCQFPLESEFYGYRVVEY